MYTCSVYISTCFLKLAYPVTAHTRENANKPPAAYIDFKIGQQRHINNLGLMDAVRDEQL